MIDLAAETGRWQAFNILVISPTPTHPQDHGNRKRIYEICTALRRKGARIHFVHYPGEHDWRSSRPVKQEEAMKATWDSYQLVAPSRPLHTAAIGFDHFIDEWADAGLQHYVAWICRLQPFDLVIVNYTWMSFCLDAVPADVFKICDTHDVFGGRRQLLEANGIAPEFFHTTSYEEAKGLSRANLVWAIKESERKYFESELGLPNCLTMLHAEPDRGWWNSPPSSDGWLRAGVIGARNKVNRRNLEMFLADACPVFEKHMAPVKIVIAGGCADDFVGWRNPNVEILGRVSEVEDFYRYVDVVIAPMQFSTGLKIKVAEALASGAPLIAHAHAMEGFPTKEPMHLLDSFKAIALELVKLSFDSEPLAKLAASSRKAHASIQCSVETALEATRGQVVESLARTICVVAPMEALDPNSLLHDHLFAAMEYLRFTNKIALFVMGSPAKVAPHFLDRFNQNIRVFLDPELGRELGAKAPENWTPIALSSLLATRGFERAYFLTDCRDKLIFGMGALKQAYVRHDAIEIAGGDADSVIDVLRTTTSVFVIGANDVRILRWRSEAGVSDVFQTPFRRTGQFESLEHRADHTAKEQGVIVFCCGDDPVARGVAKLAAGMGVVARLHDCLDPTVARDLRWPLSSGAADPLSQFLNARLIVDLTNNNSLALALGEAAGRAGIPRIALMRGAIALGMRMFPSALAPATLGALFRVVADCAFESEPLKALRRATLHDATSWFTQDAGWTKLWKVLSTAASLEKSVVEDAAASLLG